MKVFSLLLILFTLVGCEKTTAPNSVTHVSYQTADSDANTERGTKKAEQSPSMDLVQIEKKIVDLDVKRFNGKKDLPPNDQILNSFEVQNWLLALAKKTPFTDSRSYKLALERSLSPNQDIPYNGDGTTLSDLYRSNKIDSRSGTLVFFLSLLPQFKTSKEFSLNHWVFILEPGHVLPGFMEKEGNDWHLYGIEMTASGDGLRDYGLASTRVRLLRIVGAISALQILANEDKSGSDLLGFGTVETPTGDQKRVPYPIQTNTQP